MRWFLRVAAAPDAAPPGCRHCRALLATCATCGGSFDGPRLCQDCMRGLVCPRCRRYWTWA